MNKITMMLALSLIPFISAFSQSCPNNLSGQSSSTEPFFKIDQGSSNCSDYPDRIVIGTSKFDLLSCNGANLKYTLVEGPPLSDPFNFTVDFGIGPCDYVDGELQTLGIEGQENVNSVSVFPNPVNSGDQVYFKPRTPEEISLKIYNLNGKLVRILENVSINGGSIDTTTLNSGVYLLMFQTEKAEQIKKLIVY